LNEPRWHRLLWCYPIHHAVRLNDAKAVRHLCRAGADLSKRDYAGRTARTLAETLQRRHGTYRNVLKALK
jgi:ankyrin repeat protein